MISHQSSATANMSKHAKDTLNMGNMLAFMAAVLLLEHDLSKGDGTGPKPDDDGLESPEP